MLCWEHSTRDLGPPSITGACRQVRQETLQRYYSSNTFNCDLRYFQRWLELMDSSGAQLPDRVRLLVPKSEQESWHTFQIAPLIKALRSIDTTANVPQQLLEVASIGFSNRQKSLGNHWAVIAEGSDLTNSMAFWSLVRNPAWRYWLSMKGNLPAFVTGVNIAVQDYRVLPLNVIRRRNLTIVECNPAHPCSLKSASIAAARKQRRADMGCMDLALCIWDPNDLAGTVEAEQFIKNNQLFTINCSQSTYLLGPRSRQQS